MTASTRIVIPTKSLVKISTTSPRASIEEVANILSGASAGVGQGKGANMVASATTGNDSQTNDGGCPHAGGIVWVSSVESSDVPDIQMGAPGGVPLPAPNGFTDPVDYVVNGILPNIDARPNLDIGYGDTAYFYTQVAAAVNLSGTTTLADLMDGDTITVCGVTFIAVSAGNANLSSPEYFDKAAVAGSANRWENKVGNHPFLCGKIIAEQGSTFGADYTLLFGSVTSIPAMPFTFAIHSSTFSVEYQTPLWVDGSVGQVDPVFGTPLVLMYESNAEQFAAGYGFSFDSSGDPVAGLAPYSDPGAPTVTGFNGTNDVPTVTSVLRGAVISPEPAHSIGFVLSQKSVASYYPQTSAVAPLFAAGDARSVTQALVRLIKSCLSGTDGSRSIDEIQVFTYNGAVQQQTFTWTVGSR